MAVKHSKPRIQRGYARHKKDHDRLKMGGIRTIYRAEEGETLDKIALRDDIDLFVCDGFRALGKDGKEIAAEVKRIHARGTVIIDLATRRNSLEYGLELMAEALEAFRPGPEHTAMMRSKKAQPRRTHEREARATWFNAELSVIEKLRIVKPWGWTRDALYKKFGKTNVGAGRRPNALKK